MSDSFRGREATAPALGRTWTFSRWTRNVLDDFTAWARTKLPDPLEIAEKSMLRKQRYQFQAHHDAKLNDVEREFLIKAYQEQMELEGKLAMGKAASFLSLNSPEFRSLMASHLGTAQLFFYLLKLHHADITEDLAFEIVRDMSEDDIGRVMESTSGKLPKSGNESAPAVSP